MKQLPERQFEKPAPLAWASALSRSCQQRDSMRDAMINHMLLAYIDEIGETGAFVARDDRKFNTSPAFGYAGFIIPANEARHFGACFVDQKRALFRKEIEQAKHPGRWERKGADIFRKQTPELFPQHLRVFDALVNKARKLQGQLFYYADEKPIGTPKQTNVEPAKRETAAMQETLNRIARHAESHGTNVMVMIDQINEKTRAERLPTMYSHILGRAADHQEMRRIIEPPMHVDSQLSANIQFADWIAACVSRAIAYQLVEDSPYEWVTDRHKLKSPFGAFTHESKLHLWQRAADDLHHSEIFRRERVLHPIPQGQLFANSADPRIFHKMKAAAERANARS